MDESESRSFGFAITGQVFRYIVENQQKEGFKTMLRKVLDNTSVYANMSPDDKALLIESLQADKTHVAMVGDGANDCRALKKADVGISISNTEASIAAPFTSRRKDISCVPILLKEGRGSLAMSFQAFKFVELQSVIQFFSITLLYQVGTDMSDNEVLYINLFIILPLSIFMSWTKPSDYLTPDTPTVSLFTAPFLLSIVLAMIL